MADRVWCNACKSWWSDKSAHAINVGHHSYLLESQVREAFRALSGETAEATPFGWAVVNSGGLFIVGPSKDDMELQAERLGVFTKDEPRVVPVYLGPVERVEGERIAELEGALKHAIEHLEVSNCPWCVAAHQVLHDGAEKEGP